MINVQATRKSTVETAPAREDYEEKQDRRRRFVPLIFLLIVGSCTAYLKSFLPMKLGASEDREKVARLGRGGEILKEDALAATEEPVEAQPEAAKSSGRTEVARIVAHDEERAVGGGATDFSARARTDRPELNNKGSGERPKVANDNHRPRQEEPGYSSVGGGGGGGGGDRPRDPPAPDYRNRAPRVSGAVHLPDVVACHGLAISMAALLAGATDPDGDNLTVVGIYSSSGSLVRTEDGWEFDRAPNMLGEVKLTYAISDGSHIVMQTAYFNVVEAPPIVGTESDDILLGTQCAETIMGLGGEDNIDEPVDLFAQRQQLLPGLLECLHQLGIAGRQRVDPGLELVNIARTARDAGVVQLLAQNRGLTSEFFQLGSILCGELWFAWATERFTLKLTHVALLSAGWWCGG